MLRDESATQHSHIAMPKDHADDPTSVVYIVCKFHIENVTRCGISGVLFALTIVVLSSLLANIYLNFLVCLPNCIPLEARGVEDTHTHTYTL